MDGDWASRSPMARPLPDINKDGILPHHDDAPHAMANALLPDSIADVSIIELYDFQREQRVLLKHAHHDGVNFETHVAASADESTDPSNAAINVLAALGSLPPSRDHSRPNSASISATIDSSAPPDHRDTGKGKGKVSKVSDSKMAAEYWRQKAKLLAFSRGATTTLEAMHCSWCKEAQTRRVMLPFEVDFRRRLQMLWAVHWPSATSLSICRMKKSVFCESYSRLLVVLFDGMAPSTRDALCARVWDSSCGYDNMMNVLQYSKVVFELVDSFAQTTVTAEYNWYLDMLQYEVLQPAPHRARLALPELVAPALAMGVDTDVLRAARQYDYRHIDALRFCEHIANPGQSYRKPVAIVTPAVIPHRGAVDGEFNVGASFATTFTSLMELDRLQRPKSLGLGHLLGEIRDTVLLKAKHKDRSIAQILSDRLVEMHKTKAKAMLSTIISTAQDCISEHFEAEAFVSMLSGAWPIHVVEGYCNVYKTLRSICGKGLPSMLPDVDRQGHSPYFITWELAVAICRKMIEGWYTDAVFEEAHMFEICLGNKWLVRSVADDPAWTMMTGDNPMYGMAWRKLKHMMENDGSGEAGGGLNKNAGANGGGGGGGIGRAGAGAGGGGGGGVGMKGQINPLIDAKAFALKLTDAPTEDNLESFDASRPSSTEGGVGGRQYSGPYLMGLGAHGGHGGSVFDTVVESSSMALYSIDRHAMDLENAERDAAWMDAGGDYSTRRKTMEEILARRHNRTGLDIVNGVAHHTVDMTDPAISPPGIVKLESPRSNIRHANNAQIANASMTSNPTPDRWTPPASTSNAPHARISLSRGSVKSMTGASDVGAGAGAGAGADAGGGAAVAKTIATPVADAAAASSEVTNENVNAVVGHAIPTESLAERRGRAKNIDAVDAVDLDEMPVEIMSALTSRVTEVVDVQMPATPAMQTLGCKNTPMLDVGVWGSSDPLQVAKIGNIYATGSTPSAAPHQAKPVHSTPTKHQPTEETVRPTSAQDTAAATSSRAASFDSPKHVQAVKRGQGHLNVMTSPLSPISHHPSPTMFRSSAKGSPMQPAGLFRTLQPKPKMLDVDALPTTPPGTKPNLKSMAGLSITPPTLPCGRLAVPVGTHIIGGGPGYEDKSDLNKSMTPYPVQLSAADLAVKYAPPVQSGALTFGQTTGVPTLHYDVDVSMDLRTPHTRTKHNRSHWGGKQHVVDDGKKIEETEPEIEDVVARPPAFARNSKLGGGRYIRAEFFLKFLSLHVLDRRAVRSPKLNQISGKSVDAIVRLWDPDRGHSAHPKDLSLYERFAQKNKAVIGANNNNIVHNKVAPVAPDPSANYAANDATDWFDATKKGPTGMQGDGSLLRRPPSMGSMFSEAFSDDEFTFTSDSVDDDRGGFVVRPTVGQGRLQRIGYAPKATSKLKLLEGKHLQSPSHLQNNTKHIPMPKFPKARVMRLLSSLNECRSKLLAAAQRFTDTGSSLEICDKKGKFAAAGANTHELAWNTFGVRDDLMRHATELGEVGFKCSNQQLHGLETLLIDTVRNLRETSTVTLHEWSLAMLKAHPAIYKTDRSLGLQVHKLAEIGQWRALLIDSISSLSGPFSFAAAMSRPPSQMTINSKHSLTGGADDVSRLFAGPSDADMFGVGIDRDAVMAALALRASDQSIANIFGEQGSRNGRQFADDVSEPSDEHDERIVVAYMGASRGTTSESTIAPRQHWDHATGHVNVGVGPDGHDGGLATIMSQYPLDDDRSAGELPSYGADAEAKDRSYHHNDLYDELQMQFDSQAQSQVGGRHRDSPNERRQRKLLAASTGLHSKRQRGTQTLKAKESDWWLSLQQRESGSKPWVSGEFHQLRLRRRVHDREGIDDFREAMERSSERHEQMLESQRAKWGTDPDSLHNDVSGEERDAALSPIPSFVDRDDVVDTMSEDTAATDASLQQEYTPSHENGYNHPSIPPIPALQPPVKLRSPLVAKTPVSTLPVVGSMIPHAQTLNMTPQEKNLAAARRRGTQSNTPSPFKYSPARSPSRSGSALAKRLAIAAVGNTGKRNDDDGKSAVVDMSLAHRSHPAENTAHRRSPSHAKPSGLVMMLPPRSPLTNMREGSTPSRSGTPTSTATRASAHGRANRIITNGISPIGSPGMGMGARAQSPNHEATLGDFAHVEDDRMSPMLRSRPTSREAIVQVTASRSPSRGRSARTADEVDLLMSPNDIGNNGRSHDDSQSRTVDALSFPPSPLAVVIRNSAPTAEDHPGHMQRPSNMLRPQSRESVDSGASGGVSRLAALTHAMSQLEDDLVGGSAMMRGYESYSRGEYRSREHTPIHSRPDSRGQVGGSVASEGRRDRNGSQEAASVISHRTEQRSVSDTARQHGSRDVTSPPPPHAAKATPWEIAMANRISVKTRLTGPAGSIRPPPAIMHKSGQVQPIAMAQSPVFGSPVVQHGAPSPETFRKKRRQGKGKGPGPRYSVSPAKKTIGQVDISKSAIGEEKAVGQLTDTGASSDNLRVANIANAGYGDSVGDGNGDHVSSRANEIVDKASDGSGQHNFVNQRKSDVLVDDGRPSASRSGGDEWFDTTASQPVRLQLQPWSANGSR